VSETSVGPHRAPLFSFSHFQCHCQVVSPLEAESSAVTSIGQPTPDIVRTHNGLEPFQERAFRTPPSTSQSPSMLASVMHAHGSISCRPPTSSHLETVLSDLVHRRPRSFTIGTFDSELGTRPVTPTSSHTSPGPGTEASALRVSTGLALGVASAAGSPQRDEADVEGVRQGQQELRRQVAILHNMQQRGTAGSMGEACRVIQHMIDSNPEAKQFVLLPSVHDLFSFSFLASTLPNVHSVLQF
jgi:hypothetical protein